MSQTKKVIMAVVITAIIVGGGIYLWQNQEINKIGTTENEKTFIGNSFSFNYPEKYIDNEEGLWTKDGYEWQQNPPEGCSTCDIPYIEIKAEATNKTLEKYIIDDYDLPGSTLEEMMEQTGITYQNLKLDNKDFVKITVSDLYTVTSYYTKHNNTTIAFRTYSDIYDDEELQKIISSLEF